MAFLTKERNVVYVVRSIGSDAIFSGASLTFRAIPTAGEVLALGAMKVGYPSPSVVPIWVERAKSGLAMRSLRWNSVAEEPTVDDMEYPFPNGSSPRFASSSYFPWLVITDITSDGYLKVGILDSSQVDVQLSALTLTAPGATLGPLIEGSERDFSTDNEWGQQVVQFFEDTQEFVAIEIREDKSLREYGRGRWPYHVVGGEFWYGVAVCDPPVDKSLQWPMPFVVLNDNGQIHTWDFTRGLDLEEYKTPFAVASQGTQSIFSFATPLAGIWTISPAGKEQVYVDSDCGTLTSTAMREQGEQITESPLSMSSVVDGRTEIPHGFTANSTFYNWR